MGLTQKQRDLKAARAAARAAAEALVVMQPPVEAKIAPATLCDESTQRRAIIETAAALVYTLGETTYTAQLQLLRSVRLLGPDLARDLLAEALRIDAEGGELIANRSRSRTPGGIYFRLVRDLVTPHEWWTRVVGVSPRSEAS